MRMHSQASCTLVGHIYGALGIWAPLLEPCLLISAVEMVLPYGTAGGSSMTVYSRSLVNITTVAS